MPHKHEKEGKIIPRVLKRGVKLTLLQRDEIRENVEGLSNHQLASKYGVSRRLIQFIRFPERAAKNLMDRQIRGGTMQYYEKEKHRESMLETRRYRTKLDIEGKLMGKKEEKACS